jgi:Domain of unknown function (DUF4352)
MGRIAKWSAIGCGGLVALAVVGVVAIAIFAPPPTPEERKQVDKLLQEGQKPQQAQPEKLLQVGDTATPGEVEWIVTEAFRTPLLRSNFGTSKQGDFILIEFTFTNGRSEEVTIDPELHMTLTDDQGQKYGTDVDAYEFVPVDKDIFLQPVNPGVSQDGIAVYQVSEQASGFTFAVDDVALATDEQATYDLSNIEVREAGGQGAESSASASATAY